MRKSNKNNFRRIKKRINARQKPSTGGAYAKLKDDATRASGKYVIVYKSELDFISRCILDRKRIETGGQLFGFYTATGIPVVCYAIGPGARANHQVTFFNQDLDYLETVGKRLSKDFALQHIGEWHSHHQLGLDHPSGHDAANIRGNVDRLDLPQFLLCIGVCNDKSSTLNAFDFRAGESGYEQLPWMIKDTDSPYRQAVDNSLGRLIRQPVTADGNMRNMLTVNRRPDYNAGYWLTAKGNERVLKAIYDEVAGAFRSQPRVVLDDDKCVHLIISSDNDQLDICFGPGFPESAPETRKGGRDIGAGADWRYKGDIEETFKEYLKKLKTIKP